MTDLLASPSVSYTIDVIWSSGERTHLVTGEQPLDLQTAAERLEILAQELVADATAAQEPTT